MQRLLNSQYWHGRATCKEKVIFIKERRSNQPPAKKKTIRYKSISENLQELAAHAVLTRNTNEKITWALRNSDYERAERYLQHCVPKIYSIARLEISTSSTAGWVYSSTKHGDPMANGIHSPAFTRYWVESYATRAPSILNAQMSSTERIIILKSCMLFLPCHYCYCSHCYFAMLSSLLLLSPFCLPTALFGSYTRVKKTFL